MEGGGPSRKRPFLEGEEDLKTAPAQKRVRFPKGKKVKTGENVFDDRDSESLPGWREPRLAANERAMARNELTAELLEEENGEEFQDITKAEIHYEENETFVDEGIHLEPFNLTKEREEGYFDAAGNYVEYINEEIKDAWLDSIDAYRNFAPSNTAGPNNQDDAPDLSSANIAEIKRRIADTLQPGETVLRALRRLKGTSNNKKEKMSNETKQLFDQLTEDAMRLLENGDYNVYDEKQETFKREAEGYEKLAEARRQAASANAGPSEPKISAEDTFDMFAEEDGDAAIKPVSNQNGFDPNSANRPSDSENSQNDYVFDEASGYYYSSSLGYYYDPSSGLYCYAASGKWYSYNEATGTYEECQSQQAAPDVSS